MNPEEIVEIGNILSNYTVKVVRKDKASDVRMLVVACKGCGAYVSKVTGITQKLQFEEAFLEAVQHLCKRFQINASTSA